MSSFLERLEHFESDIRYQIPSSADESEFRYLPGRIPVLISAPHGAAHTRKGQLKYEDEYTAAFSLLVAELTGAHVLYARRRSVTDPNWYADVPYKRMIEQIAREGRIGFLLDLHGAAARRNFGLALGTISGESCPEQRNLILDTLQRSGFAVGSPGWHALDLDHTFTGGGNAEQETVTRFAWRRLGIPAAQCELNAHLRIVHRRRDASLAKPFHGNPEMIEQTVFALAKVVQALSS